MENTKQLTSSSKNEMSTLIEIGEAIRQKRRQKKMTQTDLAKSMKVSRQTIVKIEQGDPEFGSKSLYDDIARLLNLRFNMSFPLEEPTPIRKKMKESDEGEDKPTSNEN